MKKLIVANWKMNPLSVKDAVALAKACDKKGVVICPPFPFILSVAKVLHNATLGAQDCAWEEGGAYTGEVSAVQLKDCGVKYVIIGHSERRRYFKENNAMVARKIAACVQAGLTPILCVGETQKEKEQGLRDTVIVRQVRGGLNGLPHPSPLLGKERGFGGSVIIAYEPVWAIGTGVSCAPEQAAQAHRIIRQTMNAKIPHLAEEIKVIYGGSVDASKAAGFLAQKEIDGLLVGGSSLKPEEFHKIFKIVSPV